MISTPRKAIVVVVVFVVVVVLLVARPILKIPICQYVMVCWRYPLIMYMKLTSLQTYTIYHREN